MQIMKQALTQNQSLAPFDSPIQSTRDIDQIKVKNEVNIKDEEDRDAIGYFDDVNMDYRFDEDQLIDEQDKAVAVNVGCDDLGGTFDWDEEIEDIKTNVFNIDSPFREHQKEAINATLLKKDCFLVLVCLLVVIDGSRLVVGRVCVIRFRQCMIEMGLRLLFRL